MTDAPGTLALARTAAGAVRSLNHATLGGQGGGEPPADLGQELRQAGGGERQLADQLVGVGGLGKAGPAEGGVVQGADRAGRGAGQGQRLVRGVSHGCLLPLSGE